MRFTAVGMAPLPDIDTARHNYQLQDLSDEDVARVLLHRRKQSGNGETLAWDQLRFGAVVLIQVADREARIETLTLGDFTEPELIAAVFRAMADSAHLVTWGGTQRFVPLLQFRCLKHRHSAFDYWTRVEEGRDPHLDLQRELSGGSSLCDAPPLDQMARRLYLPGLLGRDEDSLWEHWLAGETEPLRAFAGYEALNTALLALEIFLLRGRVSLEEVKQQQGALMEGITDPQQSGRYADFVRHWSYGK